MSESEPEVTTKYSISSQIHADADRPEVTGSGVEATRLIADSPVDQLPDQSSQISRSTQGQSRSMSTRGQSRSRSGSWIRPKFDYNPKNNFNTIESNQTVNRLD